MDTKALTIDGEGALLILAQGMAEGCAVEITISTHEGTTLCYKVDGASPKYTTSRKQQVINLLSAADTALRDRGDTIPANRVLQQLQDYAMGAL